MAKGFIANNAHHALAALIATVLSATLLPDTSAQTVVGIQTQPTYHPQSFSSTNTPGEEASLPEAPSLTSTRAARPRPDRDLSPGLRATRPFRSFAMGLTLGTGGIGLDLATPITSKLNLRLGAAFLNYTTSFTVDTIPIDGTLHLASASAAIDWFPRARSFHISPGITLYNDTTYNALIFIPGNQIVTLNDQDYTSDPADPIHGTAFLKFGNRVAPRLTVGWGNVIRHRTAGLTFPVDIGIEYITPPTALFLLGGSSCDNTGACDPIQNDPATQQNILEQQTEIVNDLHPLRFFPILSVGISYKFGH